MGFWESIQEYQKKMDEDSGRVQEKPRKIGITGVHLPDPVNYTSQIESFQEVVDKVKIVDPFWLHDLDVLKDAIRRFQEMNIIVSFGGTPSRLMKSVGSPKEVVALMRELGIGEIEVDDQTGGSSTAQLVEEIKRYRDEGFTVTGEVGKKWPWKDNTRIANNQISVEKTVEQMQAFKDAGVNYVIWEGMVVRNLIGSQHENLEGQKQLRAVVDQIGWENMIFEAWDTRCQPILPIFAWLVKEYGPNVNIMNVYCEDVRRLECIRHGYSYELDHPYPRWKKADKSKYPHWWDMPTPDYTTQNMEENYVLKP